MPPRQSVGDMSVDLDIKPRTLSFRAERVAAFAGSKMERRVYTLSLQLFGEIDHERCEHFLRHDHVRVELDKDGAAAVADAPTKEYTKEYQRAARL